MSIDGFSLHAAVRCGADGRQTPRQLCRYITRPALANDRVQTNAAGHHATAHRMAGLRRPDPVVLSLRRVGHDRPADDDGRRVYCVEQSFNARKAACW
jgi:hypothetical protein